MKIKYWQYIFSLALISIICGWWLFCAGYYFALSRSEKEKTILLSDDIVVLKYVAEELKKKNPKRAIEILQGMTEVKGAYIKATQQTLGELNIVSLALHPGTTIGVFFSEEPKSYRLKDESDDNPGQIYRR